MTASASSVRQFTLTAHGLPLSCPGPTARPARRSDAPIPGVIAAPTRSRAGLICRCPAHTFCSLAGPGQIALIGSGDTGGTPWARQQDSQQPASAVMTGSRAPIGW